MTTLTHYFERHLPDRADDAAFTSLRGLNDVVTIEVRSDSHLDSFHLWFEDGRLSQGAPPAGTQPRTTFAMDRDTFGRIVAGDLSPQVAFFTMRLAIRGDVLFGLQVGTLLAGFFRRHPWRGEAA